MTFPFRGWRWKGREKSRLWFTFFFQNTEVAKEQISTISWNLCFPKLSYYRRKKEQKEGEEAKGFHIQLPAEPRGKLTNSSRLRVLTKLTPIRITWELLKTPPPRWPESLWSLSTVISCVNVPQVVVMCSKTRAHGFRVRLKSSPNMIQGAWGFRSPLPQSPSPL